MSSLRAPAALLLLAAQLSAGEVLVVDDDAGPGVDFTSLPEALAAAASGDTLLIRDGSYPGLLGVIVEGKALTLAADQDAQVLLSGTTLTIRNVPAGQTFTVRGIRSQFLDWRLHGNAGTVWLEDCHLLPSNVVSPGAISVEDCANLVLTRCTIIGFDAINALGDGLPSRGLDAVRSQVTIHACTLAGGSGDLSMTTVDSPGADAIRLTDSTLFLAGSTLTGGFGATAPGGAGLYVGNHSAAWLLEDALTGGMGTPAGAALVEHGGPATLLHGDAFGFELESPKRPGEPVTLALQGPPGAQAWLLKALAPGGILKPAWHGTFLVDPGSFLLAPIGTIPGSGELTLTLTVPLLSLMGLQALPLYVQGVTVAAGEVSLASGSHLLLLDPAF